MRKTRSIETNYEWLKNGLVKYCKENNIPCEPSDCSGSGYRCWHISIMATDAECKAINSHIDQLYEENA